MHEKSEAKELSNVYTLEHPIQFGEELIERIELKPNGRAMQGVKMTMLDNGIEFEPYKFAELGVKLGGLARAVVDKMHPADQSALGALAMLFINGGLPTGKTHSP